MKKVLLWATVVTALIVTGIVLFPGAIDLFKGTIAFMLIAPPSLLLETVTRQKTPKPNHD